MDHVRGRMPKSQEHLQLERREHAKRLANIREKYRLLKDQVESHRVEVAGLEHRLR